MELVESLCIVIFLIMSLQVHVLFLLQYFTGLECGHKFCMQCWSEYLTTKIMEEGMGQVKMPICFLVFLLSFLQCLVTCTNTNR